MARITQNGRVPNTVALQIFAVGTGLAGGAAGIFLARELAGKDDVSLNQTAFATFVSVLFTFGAAIALVRAVKQEGASASRTRR